MHETYKRQFWPEPEFVGTRNKNLAGTGIFGDRFFHISLSVLMGEGANGSI